MMGERDGASQARKLLPGKCRKDLDHKIGEGTRLTRRNNYLAISNNGGGFSHPTRIRYRGGIIVLVCGQVFLLTRNDVESLWNRAKKGINSLLLYFRNSYKDIPFLVRDISPRV